mmetsp:Transcript_157013/g.285784  ORF Transcript_157013/g.285784 Transcript_157013/m.285784 type:complete len:204 (+) Transcript_157013:1777-2388(+)
MVIVEDVCNLHCLGGLLILSTQLPIGFLVKVVCRFLQLGFLDQSLLLSDGSSPMFLNVPACVFHSSLTIVPITFAFIPFRRRSYSLVFDVLEMNPAFLTPSCHDVHRAVVVVLWRRIMERLLVLLALHLGFHFVLLLALRVHPLGVRCIRSCFPFCCSDEGLATTILALGHSWHICSLRLNGLHHGLGKATRLEGCEWIIFEI